MSKRSTERLASGRALLFCATLLMASHSTVGHAGEAKTELSKKAAALKTGMTRHAVVRLLGKPTWVMLPGDKSDFAPQEGEALLLVWDNSPCDPVLSTFDSEMTLTGWSEGRAICLEKGEYPSNPDKGKHGCKDKKRARYCR